MGTQTITESGVAQTVSGQLISLGETKIILGTRTIGMPHIQAGTQHLPLPYAGTSEFDVAFLAGPVTRSAVERAGSTQTGAISAEPTFEIAFTLGYRTYTAFRVGSNGKAVVGNRTMTAGGSALTLEGGSVSMAMNNDLVFGDAVTTSTPRARPSSSADPAQASTAKGGNSTTSQDLEMPRPVITLGTHTYTAVQPSGTKYAVLDGKTLSIGQAISVPGGTVSFDTDNDLIMFVDPVTHPASNVTASTAATTSATAATTSIGQAVPSGPVPDNALVSSRAIVGNHDLMNRSMVVVVVSPATQTSDMQAASLDFVGAYLLIAAVASTAGSPD
ncbi:hypothetical protein DOTSEDRAFT_24968 [Dothistroma septosporum NZE10]|uniref:Uncharacterized protein n=1 Tax=Dothistroma septosporum (strain NZE10 / CBS 128990) TaxID=675120 RepID=M2YLT8_DOTSN|nr:hypothetical protein DOTSEDRAFT_24968 [Dothistroma septosporum NZE10]